MNSSSFFNSSQVFNILYNFYLDKANNSIEPAPQPPPRRQNPRQNPFNRPAPPPPVYTSDAASNSKGN